jgi:hypothetical protein
MKVCLVPQEEQKQVIVVTGIVKSLGILHYKIKDANFTVCVFFATFFVAIFHFVAFMRSNTREMYKHSLPLILQITSWRFGELKEVELLLQVRDLE